MAIIITAFEVCPPSVSKPGSSPISTNAHELTSGMDAMVAGGGDWRGNFSHTRSFDRRDELNPDKCLAGWQWASGTTHGRPSRPDQREASNPWISAVWGCQEHQMGDCRWLEEGRESVWSGGWFHRYAMCMVITIRLQTGNAVKKLP